ncbi:MAG TPA: FAD-dependent oxidoreductase [Armatimonadota bacterium]|nr:FAD-dependent oxidoreductase [Armatimonadota bacterium]
MKRFDYLMIGNSAAAIGAVEAVREAGADGSIGIVSNEPYHVYSRPRISERITRHAPVKSLSYRPPDFYRKHAVTPILGVAAVEIALKQKTVRLENGRELGYGKLLLATGARPTHLPIPGIDLDGVHYFTTLHQADGLARDLANIRHAVVIGAGPIGIQAAETLTRTGVKVTVVEALDRILALAVDEHASSLVRKLFQKHGVSILTSSRVQEIHGSAAGRACGVTLVDGTRMDCEAVIVAAGVSPRTDLAESVGIRVKAGIVVDSSMQTSEPDVYAAGDVAETLDLLTGQKRLMPIWPNAYMQGRTAGLAMARLRGVSYPGSISINATHFFEFPVISAGCIDPSDGCTELVDLNKRTGYYRRIVLKQNVPVGIVMAGDAVDRAGLVVDLIKNKVDASAFLDKLARPDFNNAHLPPELRETKRGGKTHEGH